MFILTDQTGKDCHLSAAPRRIVSLVPSQTELLYHLGLEAEVAGITKFCIHPSHWFLQKQKIGGTKDLKIELIQSLQPDLIIANKEENVKEQVEALLSFCPVYTSDIHTLKENNQMISDIGAITGKEKEAKVIVEEINRQFKILDQQVTDSLQRRNKEKPTTLYLIWRNPWMSIGADTFIHEMLGRAGYDNLMKNETRYPTIDFDRWEGKHPELIFLSSEPYPFREKHIPEIKHYFPDARIELVNGEYFSWYGSRIRLAPVYFLQLKEMIDGG